MTHVRSSAGIRRLPLVLAGAVWLLPQAVSAEVYKYVDEDGTTVYSDAPVPGAERVRTGTLNTYEAPPLRGPVEDAPASETEEGPAYESVTITEPADESAFWAADQTVNVRVSVRPSLAAEHRLQLLLDGTATGEPAASTQFALALVERGTHTLTARVVDAAGDTVIESPPSTFTLHKPSRLRRPQAQ